MGDVKSDGLLFLPLAKENEKGVLGKDKGEALAPFVFAVDVF